MALSPTDGKPSPANKVSPHVVDLVEPMCAATASLLRILNGVDDDDYALVSFETALDAHDELTSKRMRVQFCSRAKRSDGSPAMASFTLRTDWWQRVPGAQRLSGAYGFTAPPTDMTALVLVAAIGAGRIQFEDESAKMEFWTAAMRFAKQTRVARAQAGFKQYKTIPNRAPYGRGTLDPMPHQRVASYCASKSEAYALYMEQSTGKTFSAIMAVETAHVAGACQTVVIVCPKNVRTNWQLELSRFSSKRVAVFKLVGGKIGRAHELLAAFRAKLSGDYDIVYVILPYQTLVNSLTQVCAYPWDWAIIDEGHYIKSHGTHRAKACMRLRDRAKRRLLLTGTPIANHAFDLFSQLEFLGQGWSGFTSFDAFRKFYGEWEPMGHGVERLTSMQNVPLLQERLARCSFLLKKSEALTDLPAKTYDVITVEMTEEQRELYDALASQLFAEIERDIASGNKATVTAQNILTRLLRLAQITSGFVVLDKELDIETESFLPAQIDRLDPNPKLEQLVETIKEQDKTTKMIVWCCFIQDIKQITARLALEGIRCVQFFGQTSEADRDAAVEAFNNDPDVRVFIGNPAAGGVGLNLMGVGADGDVAISHCDLVIFYSQNWSAVTRAQGEERPRGFLHESKTSTGKREMWSIRCLDICAEDSIDMTIRERVTNKRLSAAKLQDIRGLLSELMAANAAGRGAARAND